MPRIKVTLDRQNCIGAAVCAAIAPQFWQMNTDGKVDLLGGTKDSATGKIVLEKEVSTKELELLQDSARSCPVLVIEVIEV